MSVLLVYVTFYIPRVSDTCGADLSPSDPHPTMPPRPLPVVSNGRFLRFLGNNVRRVRAPAVLSTRLPALSTQASLSPLLGVLGSERGECLSSPRSVLVSFGHVPRSGVARSHGSSIFNFLRNLHSAPHGGCRVCTPGHHGAAPTPSPHGEAHAAAGAGGGGAACGSDRSLRRRRREHLSVSAGPRRVLSGDVSAGSSAPFELHCVRLFLC